MHDTRIQGEQDWHDWRFAHPEERDRKISRFYRIAKSIRNHYEGALQAKCIGARILEYGCGTGSYAFNLARWGAKEVIGIDISQVAIDLASSAARQQELHSVQFLKMNAEALELEDDSFDIVCGTGILHHLDLGKALASIIRVLKPHGEAVFVEPLGHNVLINAYRLWTPNIRTSDEYPLRRTDLAMLNFYFGHVMLNYYYLTALAAVPFVNTRWGGILLNWLERRDAELFKVPFIRMHAWQVMIELSKPIKQ
ncbi:MAG: class I SAM-dependent methyltransferase [Anaerolineae bacterium]|nr:class I SAM-dependent methyltransferase [Candidatus Roseilinea sp.]MDW8451340.1 class I SAM-dependent methyltransferase [Anaerolineae bacterium]